MHLRIPTWTFPLLLIALPLSSFAAPQTVDLGIVAAPRKETTCGSLLAREIPRQAFLITARDELGALTRDDALREVAPPGPDTLQLDAAVQLQLHNALHIQLTRHGNAATPIWKGDVPCIDATARLEVDYPQAVTTCESLSRDAFIDALKKAGLSGTPHAWTQDPAPADAEERLNQWNFFSQYWLLHELHATIAEKGESPARLAALSRAYAQMGVSTRVFTGPEYAVFTARALLYAERLVAKDHASALALRTRAYARALAGFPALALADLDAAQKAPNADAPPDWVELLRHYCRYETQPLLDAAGEKGPLAGIAGQLAFLTVQNMSVDAYRMRVARQVLEDAVSCDGLAISEFMCDHSGPGWLNQLVDLGPATAGKYLPYYFSKMPDAPPAAVQQAARTRDVDPVVCEEAIGRTLVAFDNSAEPSWSMLGRLMQELTFAHVWRKADLIANKWGVSADDYLATALPLVAQHPLQPLVAYFGNKESDDVKHFIESEIPNTDLSSAGLKFDYEFDREELRDPIWGTLLWNNDHTSIDYEHLLDVMTPQHFDRNNINALLILSPDSPAAVAAQIATDWPAAETSRKNWEPRLGDHPLVASAMARHAFDARQYLEAAKWARQWATASPDVTAYQFLAATYLKQNNREQWRATLDEFLQKGESYGLESTQIQVQIADYLMAKGDYAAAEPYANGAGDSGAAWAMFCAAKCAEGLGKWDDAEKWTSENAQHYDSEAADWYLWCRRLGRGNVKAARDYYKQSDVFRKNSETFVLVGYDILENDPESAIGLLERDSAKNPDPWNQLHLALLYDEAGKTAERDRALAAAIAIPTGPHMVMPGRPQMVQLARLFQQCLVRNSTAAITERSVSRFMQGAPGEEANLCYFIGKFLELHDRKNDAKIFYAQSVWSFNHRLVNMALSGARLSALGVDPTSVRPTAESATTNPAPE